MGHLPLYSSDFWGCDRKVWLQVENVPSHRRDRSVTMYTLSTLSSLHPGGTVCYMSEGKENKMEINARFCELASLFPLRHVSILFYPILTQPPSSSLPFSSLSLSWMSPLLMVAAGIHAHIPSQPLADFGMGGGGKEEEEGEEGGLG